MLANYAAVMLVPRYGDHEKVGVMWPLSFPPHIGDPQDHTCYVATSDFVPILGIPKMVG